MSTLYKTGRLSKRPYVDGDTLPPVKSSVFVAGADTDVSCDQERAFTKMQVIGYTDDLKFVCLQAERSWPIVERLTKCWFEDGWETNQKEEDYE